MVVVCSTTFFNACEKEDNQLSNENINNEVSRIKTVPFFEVAKGDSISKDIYREKPDFSGSEDITVLYRSDKKLKSTGVADNPYPYKKLTAFALSIDNNGGVPQGYIPIDLNEGAGGKYIYLKCYFGDTKWGYDMIGVEAFTLPRFIRFRDLQSNYVENDGANVPGDLNAGAGGKYIYLWYPNYNSRNAIDRIAIVSGNSSSIQYSNWKKIDVDLNKGCGGKYIYIFYKKGKLSSQANSLNFK